MNPILFLLTIFLVQLAPTPQGPQSPATGSIEGIVNKFGTTDGVSKAKVTLTIVQGGGTPQAVTADNEGKFAFRNLPPGQYRLNAARDGYVSADYGQRGPNGTGVPITVNPPQLIREIRIGLVSTGAISGRVVNRDGEPVGNANVQAMRYTYQDGRRTLTVVQTDRTNDLGEYRLFWMTPGQYIVSAEPVVPLALDSGATFFVQGARGGGPGALAGALGAQLGVGGVTRITITGGGGPGGPGGPPGPGGPGGAAPPAVPPPPVAVDNPEAYLPVYYPGTTDLTSATAIDLRAGGSAQGINLTVAEVHPVRIRGQVTSGGRPASGAQVSIYARSSTNGNVTIRGTTVSDTGSFEFRNVAPGAYELAATMNGAGPGALLIGTPIGNAAGLTKAITAIGQGGKPGQPMMATRAPVDVNNSDINGLSLALEPAFNVNGRVSIEGRTMSDSDSVLTGMRIQLQSDPLIPPLAVSPANPEGNGTFAISGVAPGAYRLTLGGLPRNTYIKSAQIGGVDVLNDGLRLDREPGGQFDIVLGSTPGTLDVTALDDRLMPVSGATVVLIPDGAQQKRYDLYRNATSDASGKIHLDGVAPGNYKVFAWEDVENAAWTDAEYMRSYEGRGTAVRIGDGSRATSEVKVIPYKVN